MVTKNSTTITLTGKEQTVQFDRPYPYFWVQNLGDSDVFISVDGGIVAGADGVITVPAGGSCGTMHGYPADKLYLLGGGKVQVMGTGSAFNPFRNSWKGGVDGTLSKAGYAADSKVVGDKLKVLQDVINGVTHRFVTDNTTAYSKSVPVGAKIASVNKVGGRTICFNQLTNADIISEDNEFYNLAFDDNGFLTMTLVNPDIKWARIRIAKNVKNHKLFVHFDIDIDISSYLFTYAESIDGQTQMIGNNEIGNNWYMVQPTLDILLFQINDYWYTADSLNVRISTFDLTKMFGAGNEPSTVEEFEAMFPDDYYPYNEGTLMPSPITAFNSIIDGRILQTKEMPSDVLALDGYGDGINNDVYNYIEFGDRIMFNQRVGVVDLGTLGWRYENTTARETFRTINKISGIRIGENDKYLPNMICSIYNADTFANVWLHKSNNIISIVDGNSQYLALYNSSYTDAATFKEAMSGVMLYYELAEPIVTDITDMFPADFNILNAMTGGKIVFENTNKIAVPNEVEYIVDLAEVIAND